jgi:hypothetical protein
VYAGAALAYSVLASFILSCAHRNRRARRPNPPMLTLVGLALMSASFTASALLLALGATMAG